MSNMRPLPSRAADRWRARGPTALPAYFGFGRLAGGALKVDGVAAGFFLSVDFGFFASRLERFCPLANSTLLRLVQISIACGRVGRATSDHPALRLRVAQCGRRA
jgi:hypothetical protein